MINNWKELYWKLPIVIILNIIWVFAGLIDFMGFRFHGF